MTPSIYKLEITIQKVHVAHCSASSAYMFTIHLCGSMIQQTFSKNSVFERNWINASNQLILPFGLKLLIKDIANNTCGSDISPCYEKALLIHLPHNFSTWTCLMYLLCLTTKLIKIMKTNRYLLISYPLVATRHH